MRRTLDAPAIDTEKMTKKLRETPADPNAIGHDPCDPYCILLHYRSLCPLEQIRLFCQFQSNSQKNERAKSIPPLPYCSNPNLNIGENVLGKMTAELALKCGFENPEKCTNHGNKALACSIMQSANIPKQQRLARQGHSNDYSERPYCRRTDAAEKLLQDGLCAVAPPASVPLTIMRPPMPPPLALPNRTPQDHSSYINTTKELLQDDFCTVAQPAPVPQTVTPPVPPPPVPPPPLSIPIQSTSPSIFIPTLKSLVPPAQPLRKTPLPNREQELVSLRHQIENLTKERIELRYSIMETTANRKEFR